MKIETPSHGIHKDGLTKHLEDANWIINHQYPTQSPNLNPIEAIWNIIKQRLRRRVFYSDEEMEVGLTQGMGQNYASKKSVRALPICLVEAKW